MLALLLVSGLALSPPDTVVLDVQSALGRGLDASPILAAALHRADAVAELAAQARAWPNPHLGLAAENVGQQSAFTGLTGWDGLEGQAVLTAPLPLGWERSGSIRVARAEDRIAQAGGEVAELQVRAALIAQLGAFLRQQALVQTAREELGTLTRIAEALSLQASAGRAPTGDAARAQLARVMAVTGLARREAALARNSAELARQLGLSPDTPLRIETEPCDRSTAPPTGMPGVEAPELRIAEARVDAARGYVVTARGLALPDLEPQLGLRRTGGQTGFYLGLSTQLPLFDLGARRLSAARAQEQAALADQEEQASRWVAGHAAALNTLAVLQAAGESFGQQWRLDLEQTVTAAEARYELGEGTLVELLDSRRARLQALDDYHAWLAEWWGARTELARLEGRPLDASLLCTDPLREIP